MKISLEECKSFQGWLKKKSPSLMGGWQKRFFRILDGQLIVYLEKEDDSKIKGQMKITEISKASNVDKTTFNFQFCGRDFTLQAENEELCLKWVNVINTLVDETEKMMKTTSQDSQLETEDDKKKGKSNKMETIDKSTLDLLKRYGLGTTDDNALSNKLLVSKGIDKLLNLNDPKIQSRIHHGFLFKHHKSQNYYQKRWFFIYSHRPLSDDKYITDDSNIDKQKEWLTFDSLCYFKYEDENEKTLQQSSLDLSQSHKIEAIDKEGKYFIILDVEDRIYEFYSEIKGDRDKWFEVLKNSRRTAKEYKASVTKHPRNVELLNSIFEKGQDKFKEKLEEEMNKIVGNYKETKEYTILDFTLTNFEELIETTLDGCNSTTPAKPELLTAYSEHMNSEYLLIIKYFWETQYNTIDSADILKIAMKLFLFEERLEKIRVVDQNFGKNARELVKIYMKKTYKNMLDVIENILKSEREIKSITNENGNYVTNGPNDLFDILSKTFDLVKDFKIKYIYEQVFELFHECIIQYLIGVDCVTSDYTIQVDKELLLAVANNSVVMIQLLNQLIDDSVEQNVLTEKEINESIRLKQIMTSINLMTQNSITRFVGEFSEPLGNTFSEVNFLELDTRKILFKTNELFVKYNQFMNSLIIKKCWEEILKLSVFYYIKSLLTTAHKKVKKVEDLRDKIKNDQGLLNETYEPVVGKNLTQANLKILSDIYDFLEISSYMISSSCLTIREYIGPSFSLSTAKAMINLRVDFNRDEKKDAIAQCKDVLDKYVDKGNTGAIGFFDKMEQDIKDENEEDDETKEDQLSDVEDEEEQEKEKKTVGYSIDDFLKDDNEEEEELLNEEAPKIDDKKEENEEVSDIVYEGTMEKKSHTSWQERYFQLKNGYLYWFKDKESMKIQNKLSIENTLRVESHKNKKFMMIVSDGSKDKGGKNSGKVYKFSCVSEDEKQKWINAITNEMKKLRGELKKEENKIEMKIKKKVITDLFKLPDVGKDRLYMKTRTRSLMQKETYFPKIVKQKRVSKKNSLKYKGQGLPIPQNPQPVNNNTGSTQMENFEIENPKVKEEKGCCGGIFDGCIKFFKNLFSKKNEGEGAERLNPQ